MCLLLFLSRSFAILGVALGAVLGGVYPGTLARAQAQNGILGIYTDQDGSSCSTRLAAGRMTTLYVVFRPEGVTRSGITGAEFRIDTSGARSYVFQNESAPDATIYLGTALGAGTLVTYAGCNSGLALPVLRLLVLNPGTGANDARLRIVSRSQPSNPTFLCPVMVLCSYALVCVGSGEFILNPSGSVPCDGGPVESEWTRVKEFYR